jgi:chemotaxis protein CheD
MAGFSHGSFSGQRITIGVGDAAASGNIHATLSTYGLGSCVGIVAYDPDIRVGGMIHIMLPHSSIAPAKAAVQPAMFADTGLPLFFQSLIALRAVPERLRIIIAGGASIFAGPDAFKVGERNLQATMLYFSQHRLPVWRSEVGGSINRTLHLSIETGSVTLKTPGGVETILLGRPGLRPPPASFGPA